MCVDPSMCGSMGRCSECSAANEPGAHLADCDGNGIVTCWECGGVGGYHDCGEDCCCCLDPDEPNRDCETCEGRGYFVCPACHDGAIPPGWEAAP